MDTTENSRIQCEFNGKRGKPDRRFLNGNVVENPQLQNSLGCYWACAIRKNQFGDHEVPTDDVAVYLDSSDITLVISFSLLPFLFLNTAAKNLLASTCNKVPT